MWELETVGKHRTKQNGPSSARYREDFVKSLVNPSAELLRSARRKNTDVTALYWGLVPWSQPSLSEILDGLRWLIAVFSIYFILPLQFYMLFYNSSWVSYKHAVHRSWMLGCMFNSLSRKHLVLWTSKASDGILHDIALHQTNTAHASSCINSALWNWSGRPPSTNRIH